MLNKDAKEGGPVGELEALRHESSRLAGRLELLSSLSRRITSTLEPDAVVQDILDAACDLTSARYGALAVFEAEGRIRHFATHGVTPHERERIGDPPRGLGILGLLQEIQEPLRLADLTRHARSVGFPQGHPPMRTFLGVPIRYGDESLGNLYLTEKEDGQEFTEEDRNLLTMFAAQGAMAINNARRFQAEQQARAEAEAARQALSESEQLNRSILDSTTAVIYVKDARGRYITVNRQFEDLFHVRKEEIKGKTDYDVFSKEMADVFTSNDRRVLESHKALEVEEIVAHDDGAHTYMSSKVPIFDSTGVPYAVCSISTDITARQEIEQLKADFLSMVTHDLRGPISAIKALSGTLLMEQGSWDNKTILGDINTIDEEADRMAELVGNLLDMSRIEANSMPQDPETCHLADITSECIRQIEKSRIGGRHGIHAEVPLELPELYADYNQISRVIFNLLSNAIKYSPQGSEVHLRCYVDPKDGGMIVTEVEDHGGGIPAGDVGKIFDKFFRVTSQRGRGRPGAGLGLAICKSIVEAHDGKIWVDSQPGKGSTFFFSLPSAVVSVGI